MSVPANVQSDLSALDAAVTAQQQAVAANAAAQAALATAQTNATSAASAVTTAQQAAQAAATQLENDINAWLSTGGNPPPHQAMRLTR